MKSGESNGECKKKSFMGTAQFLQLVLERLEAAGVQYCIARNYKDYPYVITGDVDIVVRGCDLHAVALETQQAAKHLDWSPFVVYVGARAAHLGFYADVYPSRFVLTIEFFVGGAWRGLQFLCPGRAIHMRQSHGIFWKPNPAHEAIITLLHHILYNGTVFNKYRKGIKNLTQLSPIVFQNELRYALGHTASLLLTKLVLEEDWIKIEKRVNHLRFIFILRSILLRPVLSLSGVYMVVKELRRKQAGVIIIFNNIRSEVGDVLAKEILDISYKWHIFIPPKKEIFKTIDNKSLKTIKLIAKSGGVAIMINPDDIYINLIKNNERIIVQQYIENFEIIINGTKKICFKNGITALEIWNTILKNRSKTFN